MSAVSVGRELLPFHCPPGLRDPRAVGGGAREGRLSPRMNSACGARSRALRI
ncbi:hypothetical protein [Streptomyces sp. NRRL S-646]|uniref:hypothetical protein n=1 Tax=Streptomyces sp. NRRL S-646 TaxID=1463917 RepID=UPI000B1EF596|nr:hypothetical protein [Streptomyces sp. NRRL S-646]